MGDDFRKYLRSREARLGGLKKEKSNIIRAISILILSMGVFFYPSLTETSSAKGMAPKENVSLATLITTKRLGTFTYVNSKEKEKKGVVLCAEKEMPKPSLWLNEKDVLAQVAGHPIAEMSPYITKRNKPVASFLLAIAKKESDWGEHSPLKYGKTCYNYWGYKGGYNVTESGYSCFDSPEQAVKEVGDRIEQLLGQQINTPSRMIVWKCGRTCVGHDPAGVAKWISDVALYYGKFNS